MTKTSTLIFSLFVLLLSGCSQAGTSESGSNQTKTNAAADASPAGGATSTKPPPKDVVRVEATGIEMAAGGSAEAVIKLIIANGYHINANPPSFSYLKATSLEIEPDGGITPGGAIYPASVTRMFAFSKDPLAVYEGETVIKQPLKAESSARKGAQSLKAKVRIQACDEEACYPPVTIETSIPVTIK
jgi:hypothetical protein